VTPHAVEWSVRIPVVPQPEESLAALGRLAGPLAASLTPTDRTKASTITLGAILTFTPEARDDFLHYTDFDQEITPLGPGSGLLLGGYSAGAISLTDTSILQYCILFVYILW
jgi:hypothetical protein